MLHTHFVMYLVFRWSPCPCCDCKVSWAHAYEKVRSHLKTRPTIVLVFSRLHILHLLATRIVDMATYGKIEEFDRDTDTLELYIEHLNFYFEANRISNEGEGLTLRRAILLSSVGRKAYKLMCDVIVPEKPGAKSNTELCTMVKNHFNPKPSESVQRHKFNNRFRVN